MWTRVPEISPVICMNIIWWIFSVLTFYNSCLLQNQFDMVQRIYICNNFVTTEYYLPKLKHVMYFKSILRLLLQHQLIVFLTGKYCEVQPKEIFWRRVHYKYARVNIKFILLYLSILLHWLINLLLYFNIIFATLIYCSDGYVTLHSLVYAVRACFSHTRPTLGTSICCCKLMNCIVLLLNEALINI
jgi:hypothetical protein